MKFKITQSKGGTVDGKTIVFDFDELNEQSEIAAVSEVNNYGVIIGIVAVLLIAAAVFASQLIINLIKIAPRFR